MHEYQLSEIAQDIEQHAFRMRVIMGVIVFFLVYFFLEYVKKDGTRQG